MRPAHLQQPRNLYLLLLLVALCVYTVSAAWLPFTKVDGTYYAIPLGTTNYTGFLAVAVCCANYVVFRQFFRLALGFTLLLALFNLVRFVTFTASVGITVGEITLGVNPLILPLLIIFYLLNRPAANAFIRKYLLPAPTPQQATRQRREAIDQFKQNFARKPDLVLLQIVQERKLVADAVIAAQELLAERGVSSVTTS